jgi:hypothetical protein
MMLVGATTEADLARLSYCPRCGWTGALADANCPDDDIVSCPHCKPVIPVLLSLGRRPRLVTDLVDALDTSMLPVGSIANLLFLGRRKTWRLTYWTVADE